MSKRGREWFLYLGSLDRPRIAEARYRRLTMANADLIRRMHAILDDYEQGKIHPTEVEKAILFHVDGLEALQYQKIKDAGHLCYRLVSAHLVDGEEEFICHESVADVLCDLRQYLSSLPK